MLSFFIEFTTTTTIFCLNLTGTSNVESRRHLRSLTTSTNCRTRPSTNVSLTSQHSLPVAVFGVDEARYRHFKCRELIDAVRCASIMDCTPKGKICSESRGLFNFWEISDNILETVQNEDIVSMFIRLLGNRMWPIEWHYYQ